MGPHRSLGALALLTLLAPPCLAKQRDRALEVRVESRAGLGALDGGELRVQKNVLGIWITRERGTLARSRATLRFESANWKRFRVQLRTEDANGFALRNNGLILEFAGAFRVEADVPEASRTTERNTVTLTSDARSDAFFAGRRLNPRALTILVRGRDRSDPSLRVDSELLTVDERDGQAGTLPFAVASALLTRPGEQLLDPGTSFLRPSLLAEQLDPRAAVAGSPWKVGAVGFYARSLAPQAVGRNPERFTPPLGPTHPAKVAALLHDLFDRASNAEPEDQIQLSGSVPRWLAAFEFRLRALPGIEWRHLIRDVADLREEDLPRIDAVLRLNGLEPTGRAYP
ncbi:MAG: hypothetical protein R3F62_11920 [Planctomycetota bacterium]